jgi:hypothetical protein
MNEGFKASRFQGLSPLKFSKLCLMSFVVTACAPGPDAEENKALEMVSKDIAAPAEAVTGEVPADLLNSIIEDLLTSEKMQRDSITVERAESAIFPDGGMGCPKPGEMYTQAQVQGYWVVLQSAGKDYDYRASAKGHFRRCNNSFKFRLPVG